ncbi:TetR family transcriptional regulator C-terminal domain-containing protein [Curtobacterium sp. MCSS17_015]|uniref:TetR family transcriptional regulator C-terminal domain-containing protein n=1 Tax=Curtobacterium sp. MCSS17_015 TaxID=2175666 RepID=UPI000DA7A049|nr:TetR family transcriptional regulator C-terminal domain-containing protein [Curtobacterium sp. MCSS17_015]WIB26758.1 TetR family transcriptional regulator C-terminal domain-containing protein [Curtobacterium sp. MCSS17_015]
MTTDARSADTDTDTGTGTGTGTGTETVGADTVPETELDRAETELDSQAELDSETGADTAGDELLEHARLRKHIAEAAIDLIRTGDTLTPTGDAVAAAADVDPDLLQQHFPTWESLVAVAVMHWHETRLAPLLEDAVDVGAVAFLGGLIEANLADPRMMRLLVSTLTAGTDVSNPVGPFYRNQYEGFHRTVRRLLEHDVATGREPAALDPKRAAVQLLALYEGLQLQALLRDGIDVLAAFRESTSLLRRGWTAGPAVRQEAADGVYDL